MFLTDSIMRGIYLADRVRRFVFRPVSLGVRVMLVRDGRVVLIRHTYLKGLHFPGGGAKFGESLEAAARREAREEVGAEIDTLRLFGVYSRVERTLTDHVVLFVSESFALHPVSSLEIRSVEWHPVDGLPADAVGDVRRRIAEYRGGPAGVICGDWRRTHVGEVTASPGDL